MTLEIEMCNTAEVGRKALMDWWGFKAVHEIFDTSIICAYGEDNLVEQNISQKTSQIVFLRSTRSLTFSDESRMEEIFKYGLEKVNIG